MLRRLHGLEGAIPRAAETDRFVLEARARKTQAKEALRRGGRESVHQVAVRQLAVAMLDKQPIPRACAAYAYWQSTGTTRTVIPILARSLESEDEEERSVAAHALVKVNPRHVASLVGPKEDDLPASLVGPRSVGAMAAATSPSAMTVIIHGTFARHHDWYQPGGNFHTYIRNNVYADVYGGADFFFWSGRWSHPARVNAARKLVAWCALHPARSLRLISHSHGANVANLATAMGLRTGTLIHMSPPVHNRYMPNMTNVSCQTFFNVHPTIDLVVFIDGGVQTYQNTPVAGFEKWRKSASFGHSTSHEPARWQAKNIPQLVRTLCP